LGREGGEVVGALSEHRPPQCKRDSIKGYVLSNYKHAVQRMTRHFLLVKVDVKARDLMGHDIYEHGFARGLNNADRIMRTCAR
jgi:hypothetical protein